MPLLRTETGCRWRKTLVSMTTTRFRRSRGAGWRKMLFQTCELRTKSPTDMGGPLSSAGAQVGPASRAGPTCAEAVLHLNEGFRVVPLAHFFLKFFALVHD